LKERTITRDKALNNREAKGNNSNAEYHKIMSWSLGIFTAISFILCVIYGLIVPQSLPVYQFLEAVFPVFKWLTF
jgi:hypothetical protein